MTTTEEVIRLAREAGVSILTNRKIDRDDYLSVQSSFPAMVRLIELVKAEENEACAMVCEVIAGKYYEHAKPPYLDCAEAIRARRK